MNRTDARAGGDDVSGGLTYVVTIPVLLISLVVLAGGICMCYISRRNKRNNSINPHFPDPDRTPSAIQHELQKAVPKVRVYPMNKNLDSFIRPKSLTESRILYPINETDASEEFIGNLTPINDDGDQVGPNPPFSPYHIAYVSPRLSNLTVGTSEVETTTGSESLSLPSSISRYHQSKVPGFGTIGGQSTTRLSYPIETIIESDSGSSCDVYSDNTSLLPNVGSCPNSNSAVESQENISDPSYSMPLSSAPNPSISSSMKTNMNVSESDHLVNNRNFLCFTSSYDNASDVVTSGPKEGSYLWDNYPPLNESSQYKNGERRAAKSLDDVSNLSAKLHENKIMVMDRPLLKKEMYWV